MDISAVVILDETTLQATVNPPPGGGNGGAGDGGASLSDATPQALGTPAAGTASTGSRSDHRHAMPTAAQVGADATGTAAAAVAAHVAAADPHLIYTTPQEAAAAAPVQSVSLSAPSGWSASTTNTGGSVILTLALPTGFSLPSNSSQANWDTAYSERLRWDGSSNGLNAATGRASLGLGSAAQAASADFATPSALSTGLAAKADLVGGVVPTSQIPAIAISEYLGAVGSQAAMLALTGQRGDWCLRTDGLPNTGQWILGADNAALLSSWVQIPLPTVPVQSVNGKAGVIVLGTGDLAESGGNLFHTGARAIAAALTGFTAGAGTVTATDSILQAFQKVVGNIAGRAVAGAIDSSGLTMATARIVGRSTAGPGAPEEIALGGALSFFGATLAFSDVIKLVVSNKGETATPGTNYVETTVQRACTVTGAFWELAPSATGSSSSQAMPYARRSGTKASLLSANAALAASAIYNDASANLFGTLTLAAGDTVGVDLVSVGTGSSGHIFTLAVRYS